MSNLGLQRIDILGIEKSFDENLVPRLVLKYMKKISASSTR